MNTEEATEFWSSIWGAGEEYNDEADQVHSVQVDQQEEIGKSVPCWKAPGLDGVLGYWLKNYTKIQRNN